jgi:hypothetical protein
MVLPPNQIKQNISISSRFKIKSLGRIPPWDTYALHNLTYSTHENCGAIRAFSKRGGVRSQFLLEFIFSLFILTLMLHTCM